MNKDKIINLVNSHRKLFSLCSKVYNGVSLKNKLHAKRCKVSIGISFLRGLKIVNHGRDNEIIIGDFVRIRNSVIVLNKAIKLGGTTIRSFQSSHDITGRFQNELLVHTKTICPTCKTKISKIRVGGRGTYYCEKCQNLDK